GVGPCIRVHRSRSSVTRCCAISTRWISACTRSTGSGSACTFEWAEAGRRAPGPGANGAGGSHRGGAPTADPVLLVSSVLAGAPVPGANGCGGSHRGGAPAAGAQVAVSAVLGGATAPGGDGGGGGPARAGLLRTHPC